MIAAIEHGARYAHLWHSGTLHAAIKTTIQTAALDAERFITFLLIQTIAEMNSTPFALNPI